MFCPVQIHKHVGIRKDIIPTGPTVHCSITRVRLCLCMQVCPNTVRVTASDRDGQAGREVSVTVWLGLSSAAGSGSPARPPSGAGRRRTPGIPRWAASPLWPPEGWAVPKLRRRHLPDRDCWSWRRRNLGQLTSYSDLWDLRTQRWWLKKNVRWWRHMREEEIVSGSVEM